MRIAAFSALVLGAMLAIIPVSAFARGHGGHHYSGSHHSRGGYYAGGHGSSHRGGHYVNHRTGNHYRHRKPY